MAAQVNLTDNDDEIKFCVFCYKLQCGPSDDGDEQLTCHKKTSVERFYTLTQRYLGVPVQLSEGIPRVCDNEGGVTSVTMKPCEVCIAVVASFNELYHEMKCVELKLQLKFRTLLGIMSDGSKLGSRKQSLKQALGRDVFQELAKRRKNWARHCSEQVLKWYPIVKLKNMATSNSSNDEDQETLNDPVAQTELVTKWFISLTAVAFLLTNDATDARGSTGSRLITNKFEPMELEEEETLQNADPSVDAAVRKLEPLECDDHEGSQESDDMAMDDVSFDGDPVKNQVEDTDTSDHCDEEAGDVEIKPTKPILSTVVAKYEECQANETTLPTSAQTPDECQSLQTKKITNSLQPDVQTKFCCSVCQGDKTFTTYAGFLSHKRSRGHRRQVKEGKSSNTTGHHKSTSSPRSNTGMVNDHELRISDHDNHSNCSPSSSSTSESDDEELPTNAPFIGDQENRLESCSTEVLQHYDSTIEAVVRESTCVSIAPELELTQDPAAPSPTAKTPPKPSYHLRKRVAIAPTRKDSSSDSESVPSDKDEEEYRNSSPSAPSSGDSGTEDDKSPTASVVHRKGAQAVIDSTAPVISERNRKARSRIVKCQRRGVPNNQRRQATSSGLSWSQLASLEVEFRKNNSLEQSRRSELPAQLKLTENQLVNWWSSQQNRERQPRLVPPPFFICSLDECQFKCRKKENYDSHLKLHQVGTYLCSICSINQLTPMLLCLHEASEHSQNSTGPGIPPFRCSRCPFASVFQSVYADHFGTEHLGITGLPSVTPQVCPICHVEVRFPKRHFRLAHETKDVAPARLQTCREENCEVVFINSRALDRHRIEYHKIAPEPVQNRVKSQGYGRKCEACCMTFVSYTSCRQHKFIKHNYRCSLETCKKNFLSRSELERHSRLHGTFNCPKCDFQTDYIPDYLKHDITCSKLKSPQGVITCPDCPFTTKLVFTLTQHRLETHHQGLTLRIYKCFVCGSTFPSPTGRRDHMSLQHGDNDSTKIISTTCQVCGKNCRGRRGLRRHMSLHEVLKCDICDRRYFNRNSFRVHMKFHQSPKEWKHKCQVCSERFVTKRLHDQHVKLEHMTGKQKEFSVKCEDCTEVFNAMTKYRLHRLKFHDRFKCPVKYCPLAFQEENSLELHKKLHGDFKCRNCQFKSQLAPGIFKHELACLDMKLGSRYQCPECDLIIKDKPGLIDHRLEKHLGVTRKLFKCQLCSDSFSSVAERRSHALVHHRKSPEESERCDKCPAYFKDKFQLAKHCFVCPGGGAERNYFCEMCREQFQSRQEFETHSKFHGTWNCQFCPVVEHHATDLAVHEIDAHSENKASKTKIQCPRCDWSCAATNHARINMALPKHFVSEHLRLNPNLFQCGLCQRPKRFFTIGALKTHHLKSHEVKTSHPHKCDECDRSFPRRATLLFHKLREHKRADNWKCKYCGKTLRSRGALHSHVERFHQFESGEVGEKEFSCDTPNCPWSFDTADELLYHKTYLCTRAKPKNNQLICQICGKSYKGKGALKVHMRVHDPKRPTEWKCEICSKTFKRKAAFQIHQEYHKGPEHWKFMCAVCSKKCVNNGKLQEHMRTHSKEKPFVCQVCGEKYAHKHNLQGHIRSKHKAVQLQVKKHVQRTTVSRKGKKLGANFCFLRDNDIDEETPGSDSSD